MMAPLIKMDVPLGNDPVIARAPFLPLSAWILTDTLRELPSDDTDAAPQLLQSTTRTAPSSSARLVMLIVMLGADGLARRMGDMLTFTIILPCAVTLTSAMLVQDALKVSFASGSVALTMVHGRAALAASINTTHAARK